MITFLKKYFGDKFESPESTIIYLGYILICVILGQILIHFRGWTINTWQHWACFIPMCIILSEIESYLQKQYRTKRKF